MMRMPRSSSRSGAYFSRFDGRRVVEQPADVGVPEAASAPASSPSLPTCGLCGSPSSSECAWWRRWSATQPITGPSTAIEPQIAKRYSTGL